MSDPSISELIKTIVSHLRKNPNDFAVLIDAAIEGFEPAIEKIRKDIKTREQRDRYGSDNNGVSE